MTHEEYLTDVKAFRAAHGYASNYQAEWQTLGPRPDSESEKREAEAIKAFYNERRIAGEHCGD